VVSFLARFKGARTQRNGKQIMYPLLPWRWIGFALSVVVLIAVYVDDVAAWLGLTVSDWHVIRFVPLVVLAILAGFFGPVGYWAPWRIVWRLVPRLNGWFPDINGVWMGTTESNWPRIAKLLEAAQANGAMTQEELQGIPHQDDAIAVQIKASLFSIRISAGLSSTKGQSHSLAARPRWDQYSGRAHLIPNPAG